MNAEQKGRDREYVRVNKGKCAETEKEAPRGEVECKLQFSSWKKTPPIDDVWQDHRVSRSDEVWKVSRQSDKMILCEEHH